MTRFKTLLLREWMQQRRGWLILLIAPPLLLLALTLSGAPVHMEPASPVTAAVVPAVVMPLLLLALSCIAVFAQAPGLARRDQQDRSIEFWLSLPVGHSASVGATLLMHLLAMPLLALLVGTLAGQVLAQALVLRLWGVDGWREVPWGQFLPLSLALLARGLLGVVLAVAWLAPFALLPMAGSAWLKRWGTPLVLAGIGALHGVLAAIYGVRWIGDTVVGLLHGGQRSMVFAPPPGGVDNALRLNRLPISGDWAAGDALGAVMNLGQPLFALSLAISAICFGLLVLRRRRGA